ncbi:hypothetical protein ABZ250_40285 [Streptomyces afghaniensis]|uniref:hypothetical protein n=1 Tax=Streptomyces afghaniensis TaxID=66865 RepID=UPI0033B24CAE
MSSTLECSVIDDKEDAPMGQLKPRDTHTDDNHRSASLDLLPVSSANRRANRAKTHRRIAAVPDRAVSGSAVMTFLIASASLITAWGMEAAMLFQVTALAAAAYQATNDVRKSVLRKDTTWRDRHRFISWLVRRHPLD